MDYERDLKVLKSCIKLKGVIVSDDNGKTWFVYRQDYLVHAHTQYGKFDFSEVSLEGIPLKTDFDLLKKLAQSCPIDLMKDKDVEQLNVHEQLIYKIGAVLNAMDFKELQLDLPSKLQAPPFTIREKKPYEVRDREYDVKGVFQRRLLVVEVHDKGSLMTTLVKLNELKSAEKGLVLVNVQDEQNLRNELKREQFKDLFYELRVFSREEIERLYNSCRAFHALPDRMQMLREEILEKPPYVEQVL